DATFMGGALPTGTYSAQIALDINDPAHPNVAVPATLHVTAVPVLTVTPPQLDFGTGFIGYPTARTLRVQNTGVARLEVSAVAVTRADYSVPFTPFALEPGETTLV